MDIGAFGKGKGKRGKGKHGKCKGKSKQGQQGQHGQDKDKSKDKNKDSVERWNCGKRGHYSKDCWSKKNTNKGGSKGKYKPKNADAHNVDSIPSIAEPQVEIDEFNMSYLDVDALQQQESEWMRGSEWIKLGVDTGAGKTAWPQSITYGTTIPGDSDLTFRAATGELVKGGKRKAIILLFPSFSFSVTDNFRPFSSTSSLNFFISQSILLLPNTEWPWWRSHLPPPARMLP